jgi:hypothetical protein
MKKVLKTVFSVLLTAILIVGLATMTADQAEAIRVIPACPSMSDMPGPGDTYLGQCTPCIIGESICDFYRDSVTGYEFYDSQCPIE